MSIAIALRTIVMLSPVLSSASPSYEYYTTNYTTPTTTPNDTSVNFGDSGSGSMPPTDSDSGSGSMRPNDSYMPPTDSDMPRDTCSTVGTHVQLGLDFFTSVYVVIAVAAFSFSLGRYRYPCSLPEDSTEDHDAQVIDKIFINQSFQQVNGFTNGKRAHLLEDCNYLCGRYSKAFTVDVCKVCLGRYYKE